MSLESGLFDVIETQRAIRYFKPDDVPDDLIIKLIHAATKAPSGANQQSWKFLVVRDAEAKRQIAGYYRDAWEHAYGPTPDPARISERVFRSAEHLALHMAEVPVLVFACTQTTNSSITSGSSIYPAVQNFLLAARALGLGSVLTTLHRQHESEIKKLLGIPDGVETAALLPLGYPADGHGYGPTRRAPPDSITFWEQWGTSRS